MLLYRDQEATTGSKITPLITLTIRCTGEWVVSTPLQYDVCMRHKSRSSLTDAHTINKQRNYILRSLSRLVPATQIHTHTCTQSIYRGSLSLLLFTSFIMRETRGVRLVVVRESTTFIDDERSIIFARTAKCYVSHVAGKYSHKFTITPLRFSIIIISRSIRMHHF